MFIYSTARELSVADDVVSAIILLITSVERRSIYRKEYIAIW
jgi:hypothetical protein